MAVAITDRVVGCLKGIVAMKALPHAGGAGRRSIARGDRPQAVGLSKVEESGGGSALSAQTTV